MSNASCRRDTDPHFVRTRSSTTSAFAKLEIECRVYLIATLGITRNSFLNSAEPNQFITSAICGNIRRVVEKETKQNEIDVRAKFECAARVANDTLYK